MTSLDVIGQISENLSSLITVQSFIGLALMVTEIIRWSLRTPLLGPLKGKKAWPEWGYEFYLYGKVKNYNHTLLTRRTVMLDWY